SKVSAHASNIEPARRRPRLRYASSRLCVELLPIAGGEVEAFGRISQLKQVWYTHCHGFSTVTMTGSLAWRTRQGCAAHLPEAACNQSARPASHTTTMQQRQIAARLLSLVFAFAVLIQLLACTASGQPRGPIPAAKVDATLASKPGKQTAVFAGGCFW